MTRILVVEDEHHLAEGLRFNLEDEGYGVEVAGTGEDALELLLRGPSRFDVVVLDIMLPGKDGFEVMAELRPEDVLRGFAAGADDYLAKPFELAILIARISGLVRRREWLRASMVTDVKVEVPEKFTFGEKSVDFGQLELNVRGQIFPLTVME